MFYYSNWVRFCEFVSACGLTPCTAAQSLDAGPDGRFIVLKHDVETDVTKALRLAEIEHAHGICGSYYVQAYLLDDSRNVDMLKKMQRMGHEISYHYDVLDACSGDFEKAECEFARWLGRFNDCGFSFTTICQHGNPVKTRMGYTSNRDFFRNAEIRAKYPYLTDMVVDYSRRICRSYVYVSDAGYMWKHISEPETNDLHPDSTNISIGGFANLKKFVNEADCPVIISTHPHRWESSRMRIFVRIAVFRAVRAMVRAVEKVPGIKSVLNRFYFLAKKI